MEAKVEVKVKRLYVVRSDDSCRLVNAVSGAAALRHVVRPVYRVLLAKAADVAAILTSGGTVEEADDEIAVVEVETITHGKHK